MYLLLSDIHLHIQKEVAIQWVVYNEEPKAYEMLHMVLVVMEVKVVVMVVILLIGEPAS